MEEGCGTAGLHKHDNFRKEEQDNMTACLVFQDGTTASEG
jgi:hypothetical protein